MGVEVRSKLGNSVSRSLSGSSLIGDGMLVRLRSSILAILGLVAAVSLGMVAVVSQQGWPDVLTGPLPPAPSASFAQNDPIAAPAGAFGPAPLFDGLQASAPDRSDRQAAGSDASPASNLTAARQVAAAPPEPAPAEPTAVPEPVDQVTAPTTPAPAPSPAQATAGVGSSTGGSSPPVTAGTGRPPGGPDEDSGGQDDPGPPSWADNDDDHDHGRGNDRWDDDDNGRDDWSDDDGWDDDDDRDHWSDDDRWDDDDRGRDDRDSGGWGRH